MLTTTPFEALLAARIGLDPASIGHDEVERAVETRMRARGVADPARYLEILQASEDEIDDLIELVLMKVTWFFRESGAFALVAARALEAAANGTQDAFRVLSLPCATGEEPYSIAMALLAAGVPADRIRIDGVDISRHALEVAQRGVYDARAVRFTDGGMLDRYFVEDGRDYRVSDDVKRLVTLARGNLVSPGLLAGRGPYDVVFCRNVLIYFGEAARERVLHTIDRLLVPGGLLLTGHAEGQRLVAPRFVSAGAPGACAFTRATHIAASVAQNPAEAGSHDTGRRGCEAGSPETGSRGAARERPVVGPGVGRIKSDRDTGRAHDTGRRGSVSQNPAEAGSHDTRFRGQGRAHDTGSHGPTREKLEVGSGFSRIPSDRDTGRARSTGRRGPVSHNPAEAGSHESRDVVIAAADRASLARITADADAGRLVEARRACRAFLDTHPGSAEGHYLLGVIELGSGQRRDAEAAFRRAIYLDPGHGDALLQLALVRARQGDDREAEQLRRRAARAREPAPGA